MRVYWKGDILPPGVYVGRNICIAGQIRTYSGGREFFVRQAVNIPGGRVAMRPVFEHLDRVFDDPTDWAPDILEDFT